MKYAFSCDQSIFFNWQEFKDSFRIYRRRPGATLAAYLWDLTVTGIGSLLALFLFFLPVLGFFAAAFARFMLTHWPKAYGYGILARHLIETGVFEPARYARLSAP